MGNSEQKMEICRKCEHYIEKSGRCDICKCYMSMKTRFNVFNCPAGHWTSKQFKNKKDNGKEQE